MYIVGIIDIVTLERYDWSHGNLTKTAITKQSEPKLWEDTSKARCCIIDTLASYDDMLAEKVINIESYASVSTACVVKSLGKCVTSQVSFPFNRGVSAHTLII